MRAVTSKIGQLPGCPAPPSRQHSHLPNYNSWWPLTMSEGKEYPWSSNLVLDAWWMMWGYQGTEQRCIRILAPGSTIDRTLMTVDLWRNIILKLVRSLLCLESIKWKMTRNYWENIYRMSQKKIPCEEIHMASMDHLDYCSKWSKRSKVSKLSKVVI